jgi:hypothetical protein
MIHHLPPRICFWGRISDASGIDKLAARKRRNPWTSSEVGSRRASSEKRRNPWTLPRSVCHPVPNRL